MKYRKLGRTGLQVSEIAIGAWGLGGAYKVSGKPVGYGALDRQEALRMLRRAGELGVNLIDTAPTYGMDGASEKLVGEALAGGRDKWLVCTKAGFKRTPEGTYRRAYDKEFIANTVNTSLERLRTDCLDVLLLHSPDVDQALAAGAPATMAELKAAGKARWVGASIDKAEDGLKLLEAAPMDVFMFNYNVLQQAVGDRILPVCAERGIGVMVRGPLCQGLLTDAFDRTTVFSPEDMRSSISAEELENVHKHMDIIRAAKPGGYPGMAGFALNFCLANPAVSTLTAGVKSVAELEDCLRALSAPSLSAETLQKLAGMNVPITYKY